MFLGQRKIRENVTTVKQHHIMAGLVRYFKKFRIFLMKEVKSYSSV
jgi:hypothetical protein